MNTYMKENILIVYYSYSGKTRRIAEEIQKQTGGRLSQIYLSAIAIEKCETTEMPQRLENWLALTRTPDLIREKIRQRMRADVTGNDKTGFSPYLKNNDIFFNQKWVLAIGKKDI